jgi:hypothetical protein
VRIEFIFCFIFLLSHLHNAFGPLLPILSTSLLHTFSVCVLFLSLSFLRPYFSLCPSGPHFLVDFFSLFFLCFFLPFCFSLSAYFYLLAILVLSPFLTSFIFLPFLHSSSPRFFLSFLFYFLYSSIRPAFISFIVCHFSLRI